MADSQGCDFYARIEANPKTNMENIESIGLLALGSVAAAYLVKYFIDSQAAKKRDLDQIKADVAELRRNFNWSKEIMHKVVVVLEKRKTKGDNGDFQYILNEIDQFKSAGPDPAPAKTTTKA